MTVLLLRGDSEKAGFFTGTLCSMGEKIPEQPHDWLSLWRSAFVSVNACHAFQDNYHRRR